MLNVVCRSCILLTHSRFHRAAVGALHICCIFFLFHFLEHRLKGQACTGVCQRVLHRTHQKGTAPHTREGYSIAHMRSTRACNTQACNHCTVHGQYNHCRTLRIWNPPPASSGVVPSSSCRTSSHRHQQSNSRYVSTSGSAAAGSASGASETFLLAFACFFLARFNLRF